MSTINQVIENIKIANSSEQGMLNEAEIKLIDKVREKYKEFGFVGCTDCRYCMPCSEGLNIPFLLSLYNEYYIKSDKEEIKKKYMDYIKSKKGADSCISCRECEKLCPQQLPISHVFEVFRRQIRNT